MFFFSDPYRAAQITRMNNVVELHQQSISRNAAARRIMEAAHRRTVNELNDEIEELTRYRRTIVAERNALRDQVAELTRKNRIQDEALLRLLRHAGATRQALGRLHEGWSAAHCDDPFAQLDSILAYRDEAKQRLACDVTWRNHEREEVDALVGRIAQEHAARSG